MGPCAAIAFGTTLFFPEGIVDVDIFIIAAENYYEVGSLKGVLGGYARIELRPGAIVNEGDDGVMKEMSVTTAMRR